MIIRRNTQAGGELLNVDTHCHVLCLAAEDLVADRPQKQSERETMIENLGEASVVRNEEMMSALLPKLTDPVARLADMDAQGIDMQILSPSPTQYYYWADKDLSSDLVNTQNEMIAEMCGAHPDRFAGMGAVSLQHPELAGEQLRKMIKDYGFRGVEISSTVGGREIADAKFRPFWRAAAELGIVVFIHPLGTSLGARTSKYYFANLVGQPLEITLALSQLIVGGVLDRFPSLKVLAAHGGGYLGLCSGRIDHGWRVRPETHTTPARPSDYLNRIFFDSVVHDQRELQQLIAKVGVSNVLVGSDYPFDMGLEDPIGHISSVSDLSAHDSHCICGGNAIALFGLADEKRGN